MPVPEGLAIDAAVALLADGRTATMLVDAAGVRGGDRVLVEAAAGGVGTLIVQLARAAGARVIGAAGGERKLALATSLGADAAIDYTEPGWERTAGPVDVVFDGVGGAIARAAFGLLGHGGRMVSYGLASGAWSDVSEEEATARGVQRIGLSRPDPAAARAFTARALAAAARGAPAAGDRRALPAGVRGRGARGDRGARDGREDPAADGRGDVVADDEEWLGGRLAREALDAGDPAAWFEPLYAAAEQGETQVPWDRGAPNRWLVAWAEANRPRGEGRRAIVVGAGLGDDAEHVAGLGFSTVAFDVSPTAARLARERFPDTRVDYRAADLLELPMAWRGAYDLVVEIRTVQSLPSAPRPAAIAAIRGLVAPGGTALVIAAARHPGRPGRRAAVAAHPARDRVVRRGRPADGAARRAARRGRLRLVGGGAAARRC